MVHTIRFKITAITVGAILTVILCVVLASLFAVQGEIDRRSVEVMNLTCQDVRKSLEKYTEDIEQSVETVGNIAIDSLDSTVLIEAGVGGVSADEDKRAAGQAKLDAYLKGYCSEIQVDSAAVADRAHDVITYYYCINPEVSVVEHGFFYSKVGKTGFYEREPLDAREFDPNDMEHYTWYYTPIQRGRPSWVGPYTAHFLNEMHICSYLVPIYKAGTLIGLLGMDVSVDTLAEQVKSIQVYDTGFACLLSDDGRVIYHPYMDYGLEPNLPPDADVFNQESSGDRPIRYLVNGEEHQMAFATLSNGMKLLVVAPTSEINASTEKLIHVLLPAIAAIVAIFALLIMLAMRFVTTPLQQLTEASQKLAGGDYDVQLDYESRDEVGALTEAFRRMRDQLKEDIADLNRRARTDSLTGLPNQRRFFELARLERLRLLDEGKRPVMLYFNLVGMKHFNQRYGFEEGDRLICEVADVLAREFGEQNASRFGQDHFAAVADEEGIEERLRNVFSECRNFNGGKTLPISAGIYRDSLGEADASVACDRAKYACDLRRGSYVSDFCYFDEGMLERIRVVRYIINHFDQAMEENWIEVYYQPIVRAVNGRVCDEEALARWTDPEKGVLSPADFVTALEGAGLIYKLDLYVLDRVLEKIKAHEERGLSVVPHSINLSRADFDSCDIVEEICKRVDEAGVARDRITIEVTESIIGADFDLMRGQVARFQQLGFSVWMDDFGSGYSSLDVLQSIRFDLVKFDMGFTQKLDEGDDAKIILTELMKMTAALGVETICEGVETQEQYWFLREIGCSKLQGYYFCKPLPFAAVLERYDNSTAIGFENPEESSYYETISRVNLHDANVIASVRGGEYRNRLNSVPMAVLELRDGEVRVVQGNRAYREFLSTALGMPAKGPAVGEDSLEEYSRPEFMGALARCDADGEWHQVIDTLEDGSIIHALVRQAAVNPVTDAKAYTVVVFVMSDA